MERDRFCFDFAVFDVDFIAAQYNRYIFTHSNQVSMPVWHILVGDTSRYVEHDDGALSLNVVAISQATELLLTSRVPHIESDWTSVCVEHQWVHLDTKCC